MTDQAPTATDEVDLNPERCPVEYRQKRCTARVDEIHDDHRWDSAEQERWVDETRRMLLEAMGAQRELDAQPCPTCGGDRLRPDFTGSGRCHA